MKKKASIPFQKEPRSKQLNIKVTPTTWNRLQDLKHCLGNDSSPSSLAGDLFARAIAEAHRDLPTYVFD
jgi:hypothetical protein